MSGSLSAWGLGVAGRVAPLAGLLAIWQVAVSVGVINPDILPSPYTITVAGIDLIRDGELWANLGVTLATSLGGLAIATVLGARQKR